MMMTEEGQEANRPAILPQEPAASAQPEPQPIGSEDVVPVVPTNDGLDEIGGDAEEEMNGKKQVSTTKQITSWN